MKLLLRLIIISFSLIYASWAVADYTNVAQWQSCTRVISKGPYNFQCLPPKKPTACPDSSWSTLTKNELLPWCPLCPQPAPAPTPAPAPAPAQ